MSNICSCNHGISLQMLITHAIWFGHLILWLNIHDVLWAIKDDKHRMQIDTEEGDTFSVFHNFTPQTRFIYEAQLLVALTFNWPRFSVDFRLRIRQPPFLTCMCSWFVIRILYRCDISLVISSVANVIACRLSRWIHQLMHQRAAAPFHLRRYDGGTHSMQ